MSKKGDDSKLFAFLATFLSIIGFIIALIVRRDDKYVMHYAGQSLVVFIVALIAWVLQGLAVIPVLGWIISVALNLIVLILWLFSWIYALSGEEKVVPVVGYLGKKIKL